MNDEQNCTSYSTVMIFIDYLGLGEVYHASLSYNRYQIMLVIPSSSPKRIYHSYDVYLSHHIVIIVLLERLYHHTKLSIRAFLFTRWHIDKFPLSYVALQKSVLVLSLISIYTVMPVCACINVNCVFFHVMSEGINNVYLIVIKHWSRKYCDFFKIRLRNYTKIIQFYTKIKKLLWIS